MTQEVFLSWSHKKRYSQHEIRKQQEKALQSYQQIATLEKLSQVEQQQSSTVAEIELEKFITSNKKTHGKQWSSS